MSGLRMPWRRRDPAHAIDAVAALTERLAVLLSAGVSITSVWSHLAEADAAPGASPTPSQGVLDAASAAASDGDPIDTAIDRAIGGAGTRAEASALRAGGEARTPRMSRTPRTRAEARPHADEARAWALLAAAWRVASTTGAPLAASLRDLAVAFRDDAQLTREVRSALAGAVASTRLVTALPLVAVGFGALLGFDSLRVLFGTPLGWACLAIGIALLVSGARWNSALARRAAPATGAAGLELELLAVAMRGGASIAKARATVADALDRFAPAARDDAAVERVVSVASRAGAPVADLLRAEAARTRRQARSDGLDRAAALSVRSMLPLGLCVLPAFVALGVAPLMISIVTGTLDAA